MSYSELLLTENRQKYNNDASRAIQEYCENPDILRQAVSLPGPTPFHAHLIQSSSSQQEVGMNPLHITIQISQVRLLFSAACLPEADLSAQRLPNRCQ